MSGHCAECMRVVWRDGHAPKCPAAPTGDPVEMPQWIDLGLLPYHGGGVMGRRRGTASSETKDA